MGKGIALVGGILVLLLGFLLLQQNVNAARTKKKRQQAPAIEVVKSTWAYQRGDYLSAEGNVRNNTSKTADFVRVTVRFYDVSMKYKCRADTFIDDWDGLGPGQTSPYSLRIYNRYAGYVGKAVVSVTVFSREDPNAQFMVTCSLLSELLKHRKK